MKISKSDLQRLALAMENKNLSIAQVIKLIDNVQSEKVFDTASEITLTVDYTKTIEQVIANSKYDQKDDNINVKNFPISPENIGKKVEVTAKLFHSNRGICFYDAISGMNRDGYPSATLMELLVLGFLFPELIQFPIAALGSIWHDADDDRCVPVLCVGDSRRRLDLIWFDGIWPAYYRFLGVRK